jgi:threonine/homoserine/homoserine lactone efflux protein
MIVLNVIWLTPMALAADALRRWFSNLAVHTGVNRASGGMLLVMAMLMLDQHLL